MSSMSPPRISILLPTHNRPDSLGVSIESVLAQTTGDFELLVVGDGVSDETRRVVAGFGDARLRFFDLPKAPHFGYANRNVALREARGDVIAFAADDDLWLPDHLAVMLPLFDDPGLDWAHSRPVWVSPDGLALPFFVDLEVPAELDAFLTRRNVLPASTVVHRRAAFDQVGYWPEDVPIAGDWDMWKRIILAGGGRRLASIRTPTCLHFRARRRIGETWGPPPLAEMDRIARVASWWPPGLTFAIPADRAEQVAVWSAIAADPLRVVAALRRGILMVTDKLATDSLEIYWPEHESWLRELERCADSAPTPGDLSGMMGEAFHSLPVRVDVVRPLCLGLMAAGRPAAALALARHAFAREPAPPWTRHVLALMLSGAGLAAEADANFEAMLASHPANTTYVRDFAQHLMKSGRAARAVDLIRPFVTAQPRSAAMLNALGLALEAAGDLTGAETVLAEAAAIEPANAQFKRCLADVRTRITVGDPERTGLIVGP